jgi:hypothetical protein
MRKTLLSVVTLLGVFGCVLGSPELQSVARPNPRDAWYAPIDHASALADWPLLRNSSRPNAHTEVRIWCDHGLGGLSGYLLEHGSDGYKGERLTPYPEQRVTPIAPKNGWSHFWHEFKDLGGFELTHLPPGTYPLSFDSGGITVESRVDGEYRVVEISYDEEAAGPKDKGIAVIRQLLDGEFHGCSLSTQKS